MRVRTLEFCLAVTGRYNVKAMTFCVLSVRVRAYLSNKIFEFRASELGVSDPQTRNIETNFSVHFKCFSSHIFTIPSSELRVSSVGPTKMWSTRVQIN